MDALISTPGSISANTYADNAYARNFADNIGLVLPTDNDTLNKALLNAMAYIESQPYQGRRATASQALEWPRSGVSIGSYPVGSAVIPETLKKAQVMAAYSIIQGQDLSQSETTQSIKKEKVGPIETEYFEGVTSTSSEFSSIDIYLRSLLIGLDGGYKLSASFGF